MPRDLYDVLEVARDAGPEELRIAYRKLALIWHPDKNAARQEEATIRFKEIQNAYEVLGDKNERAWYDAHREEILRGGSTHYAGADTGAPPQEEGINLWAFFSTSAFSGYGDSGHGFYGVYGKVFDEIAKMEMQAARRSGVDFDTPPSLGAFSSPYSDVSLFYAHWLNFTTVKEFLSAAEYNLATAPNRQVRRLMEAENAKKVRAQRKKFNEEVRALAAWCKKRDRRVMERAVEQKKMQAVREAEEARAHKEKLARKKAEAAALYVEQDWAVNQGAEKLTDDGWWDEGDKKKEKGAGEEPHELYCVACGKSFKSDKQWKNHEKSRKHLERAAALKEALLQEEEEADAAESSEFDTASEGDDVSSARDDVSDRAQDDVSNERNGSSSRQNDSSNDRNGVSSARDDVSSERNNASGKRNDISGRRNEESCVKKGVSDVTRSDDDVSTAGRAVTDEEILAELDAQEAEMMRRNEMDGGDGAGGPDSEGEPSDEDKIGEDSDASLGDSDASLGDPDVNLETPDASRGDSDGGEDEGLGDLLRMHGRRTKAEGEFDEKEDRGGGSDVRDDVSNARDDVSIGHADVSNGKDDVSDGKVDVSAASDGEDEGLGDLLRMHGRQRHQSNAERGWRKGGRKLTGREAMSDTDGRVKEENHESGSGSDGGEVDAGLGDLVRLHWSQNGAVRRQETAGATDASAAAANGMEPATEAVTGTEAGAAATERSVDDDDVSAEKAGDKEGHAATSPEPSAGAQREEQLEAPQRDTAKARKARRAVNRAKKEGAQFADVVAPEVTSARGRKAKKGKGSKGGNTASLIPCVTCGEEFDSRTQLFKHLTSTGHAIPKR